MYSRKVKLGGSFSMKVQYTAGVIAFIWNCLSNFFANVSKNYRIRLQYLENCKHLFVGNLCFCWGDGFV